MKTRFAHPLFAVLTGLTLAATGCITDGGTEADEFDDADVIAEALEQPNGGLDMEDEAPMFADEALFDEAELATDDVEYDDALATDAEVAAMVDAADAVLFDVTVMWGQIPGDRDNRTPYDWSGSISVNRGAILVRRALAFDGVVDHLLPRTDRRVVDFRSDTLPHRDGLRLLIVDPDPTADEPLVLTYDQVDGDEFSTPMSAILGAPASKVMDDAGNRIVAVALGRPTDSCERGFVAGRWHRVREHRGRILGRVVSADGAPRGHIRGIYGQRRSGDNVFFAKYINRAGEFRGILRGTYGRGHFAGRWLTRSGEHGVVGGEYRESDRDPRVGGHFLGRWAETSCRLDVGNEETGEEDRSDR